MVEIHPSYLKIQDGGQDPIFSLSIAIIWLRIVQFRRSLVHSVSSEYITQIAAPLIQRLYLRARRVDSVISNFIINVVTLINNKITV